MGTNHSLEQPIVYFDGVCNLCESSVQFIIKRDNKKRFQFASLQSDYAKKHLIGELTNVRDEELKSIVLKQGESLRTKSSAVLTIARHLSGLWPLIYVFIIIPKFIRDWMYDFIAKNRYRWFGKKDQCMIPTSDLKSRFLD